MCLEILDRSSSVLLGKIFVRPCVCNPSVRTTFLNQRFQELQETVNEKASSHFLLVRGCASRWLDTIVVLILSGFRLEIDSGYFSFWIGYVHMAAARLLLKGDQPEFLYHGE
jgi:hypothetical protein